MKNLKLLLVEYSVLVMLLAGCGGAQSSSTGSVSLVPVTTSRNVVNRASNDLLHKNKLFVADSSGSQILIYPGNVNNPKPTGAITSGVDDPHNLAVDQSGTLYVQNGNNTITEYHKGQKTVSKTLTEPGAGALISVVVGSDGTVYAGNGDGEVFEFADGKTKPTRILVVPDSTTPVNLALDSAGDLFVGWGVIFMNSGIIEFKPGSKVGKTRLSGLNGILAVDSHDNLLVGGGQDILIFRPGAKRPFRRIHTALTSASQMAFDSDEKYLYVASCSGGKVYVYDYETGKLSWTAGQDLGPCPSGAALSPAAPQ